MRPIRLTVSLCLAILALLGFARLTVAQEEVYIRVVDVGPGLCAITRIPGPYFMVYDSGHWLNDRCLDAAKDIIQDNDIDLLILSHNDADHIGRLDNLLSAFHAKVILRTGYQRPSRATWRAMNRAIATETEFQATVINLATYPLRPGFVFTLGDANIQFIRGDAEWPDKLATGLSRAELRNVISIVTRLEYKGRAVLFTGDTVGRRHDSGSDDCSYAEAEMVRRADDVPIQSEIMLVPHHGSNTSSSNCFIEAVSPDYVIVSAGHAHAHPRKEAMERYLNFVPAEKIFRTDRGDDEGAKEWDYMRVPGCSDSAGDD